MRCDPVRLQIRKKAGHWVGLTKNGRNMDAVACARMSDRESLDHALEAAYGRRCRHMQHGQPVGWCVDRNVR
jgi:hypothetical protein